jgi:predicted PurR-regulated permease PerM
MIKHPRVNKIVLLIMVVLISAMFLVMIRQFLMAIFMAGLISAMSAPLHRRLARRLQGRENLASAAVVAGVFCLILVPLAFLLGLVVSQAVHVGQSVTPWVQSFVKEPGLLSGYVEKIPYYEQILPYRDMILAKAGELVGSISSLLINSLSSITKMTVNALFNAVIMLYVMFYFLTEGDGLLRKMLYYLPLAHEDLSGRGNDEIHPDHWHSARRAVRFGLSLRWDTWRGLLGHGDGGTVNHSGSGISTGLGSGDDHLGRERRFFRPDHSWHSLRRTGG